MAVEWNLFCLLRINKILTSRKVSDRISYLVRSRLEGDAHAGGGVRPQELAAARSFVIMHAATSSLIESSRCFIMYDTSHIVGLN